MTSYDESMQLLHRLPQLTDSDLMQLLVTLRDVHDAHKPVTYDGRRRITRPPFIRRLYQAVQLQLAGRNMTVASCPADDKITHGGIADLRAGYRSRLVHSPRYAAPDVVPDGAYCRDADAPVANRGDSRGDSRGGWDFTDRMLVAISGHHYHRHHDQSVPPTDCPDCAAVARSHDPRSTMWE